MKETLKKFGRSLTKDKARGLISGMVVMALVCSTLLFAFTGFTFATAPSVSYASPDDGDTFVDVDAGDGVNITVNVSDADTDIQQVEIWSNSSGTWSAIYQSGALGGVGYHNHTVLDSNALEGMTTYYYNISVEDTSDGWTNTTYSYETDYVWGGKQIAWHNDNHDFTYSTIYKNASGEYYHVMHDTSASDIDMLTSSNGLDWVEQTTTSIDDSAQDGDEPDWSGWGMGVWGWHTYNDQPSFLYCDDGGSGNWMIAHYDGVSWSTSDTGITGYYSTDHIAGLGADMEYYNGEWWLIAGTTNQGSDIKLKTYYGTPYASWSVSNTFDDERYATVVVNYHPSLNILDGNLVITYINDDDASTMDETEGYGQFEWYTYDGVSYTSKGEVSSDTITSLSVTRDPIAGHLVAVYTKSGDLYYRTLDSPSGSWSSEYLIASLPATYMHPQVHYIDDRVVITVGNNQRGNYNIYTISAPDYRSTTSGIIEQYGRYEWDDASPNDVNVNSSVVRYENTGHTDWTNINLSTEDIGSIQCESNYRFWFSLDNTSWTDVGTTDASGNINDINATNFASLMPLTTGDDLYVKWEILDIGDVPEDLQASDYCARFEIYHP